MKKVDNPISKNCSALKKIILFVFLLSSLIAEAQILRVGPKAGIQASRTIFDNPSTKTAHFSYPSLSFQAGGVLNIKVSEMFSLQSEFLYHHIKKSVENKNAGDWQKESYQYLSIPLLLRASLPWGHNELYFNAGPSISYWLAGKGRVYHSEVFEFDLEVLEYEMAFSGEEASNRYIIQDPNRVQLGVDIGAGAVLPMGTNFLMVDLRYTFGHTNMVKTNEKYLPLSFYREDLQHTQQVLSLSVAYLLNLDFYIMRTKGKSTGKKSE